MARQGQGMQKLGIGAEKGQRGAGDRTVGLEMRDKADRRLSSSGVKVVSGAVG